MSEKKSHAAARTRNEPTPISATTMEISKIQILQCDYKAAREVSNKCSDELKEQQANAVLISKW
jgi:hypothetical protein